MITMIIISCTPSEKLLLEKVYFYNNITKTPFYRGMTIEESKKTIGKEVVVTASLDYRIDSKKIKHLRLFSIWVEEEQCTLFFNFYRELIAVTFRVH